jgi:hypothetical protein
MFGVTQTRVIGRKGWERWLARHGYEPSHFITSKRLVQECLTFDPQSLSELPK